MKRGDIYYIKSNHSEHGYEQRGDRPAIIVSNDQANAHSGVLEVVYLTTKPKKPLPTHVTVSGGRIVASTALCEQITSVDIGRFSDYMGHLDEEDMEKVDKALAISIGLNITESCEPEAVEECEGCEEFHRMRKALEASKCLNAELTRVTAERDIYKELYRDLLDRLAE